MNVTMRSFVLYFMTFTAFARISSVNAQEVGYVKESEEKLTSNQSLWADNIYNKSPSPILDDRTIIEMVSFSACKNTNIMPRSAAIATVLLRAVSPSSLHGPISLQSIVERSEFLAGRKLATDEVILVKKLHEQLISKYNNVNPASANGRLTFDITFGLREVRFLQNTIASAENIEDALRLVGALHGWYGNVYKFSVDSCGAVQEAIDRSIPLIFEDKDEISVCYGYFRNNDNIYLMLTIPETMPFQTGSEIATKEELESIDPRVVRFRYIRRGGGGFREDYQIKSTKKIPPVGFRIELFEKNKYIAYALMNWRNSAIAHDAELCKILKLPDEQVKTVDVISAKTSDKELWNYYIKDKEEVLGGSYSLIPSVVVPSNEYINPQYACLASTAITQQGAEVGNFSLSLGKFYRGACKIINNDYLILEGDKKVKMEALIQSIQDTYTAKHKSFESAVGEVIDPNLAAAMRMTVTMDASENIEKGLSELQRLHGWKSTIETSKNVPFSKYQKSVHKKIPILLKEVLSGKWVLCIGYLTHNSKNMLILINPSLIERNKSLMIDNKEKFPDNGLYFELFNINRYQPYFVHDWQISVDDYKNQIHSIFSDNK